MAFKRLLTVTYCLFFVACSFEKEMQPNEAQEQDIEIEQIEQKIQGGQTDDDRTYVVGLVIQQGWAGGACSGSLIAPNLVLTAQHCIAPTSSEGIACGFSTFGQTYSTSDIYVTTRTEFPRFGYYGVQEIIVPEPEAEVCGNDIALLVLNQNVMSSDAVPITPRLDDPVSAGERFTAVGYGHTGNGDGAGTRRSIANRRIICSGFQNGGQDGNQGIYTNEWLGNDGTCQGDSGGPALDVSEEVIGVLSRGPEGCVYPVYTDVIRYASWIREVAAQAAVKGSYSPPSWVAGPNGMPPTDTDDDGLPDRYDNCIDIANPSQQDYDNDGIGDLCDELISGDRGGRCPVCNTCVTDEECGGQGGICLQLQGGSICTYPCRGDFECPDTTDCVEIDEGEGYCFNSDYIFSGVCPQSYICGGEGTQPTPPEDDGMCHVCESCDRGEDCASGVCANLGNGKVCTRSCETDDECREGSVCLNQNGRKLCVNENHPEVGICPEGLICGMSLPEAGTEAGAEAGTEAGTEAGVEAGSESIEAGEQVDDDPIIIEIIDDEQDKSSNGLGCESQHSNRPGILAFGLGLLLIVRRRVTQIV